MFRFHRDGDDDDDDKYDEGDDDEDNADHGDGDDGGEDDGEDNDLACRGVMVNFSSRFLVLKRTESENGKNLC